MGIVPFFGRTEVQCARCGTSLIRVATSQFDRIVCPVDLVVGEYREGIAGAVDLLEGPIVDREMIVQINRFWLTGRQPQ